MYCSKCGKSIDDTSVFCVHCGEKISRIIENTDSTEKTVENEIIDSCKEDVASINASNSISVKQFPKKILLIGKILAIIGVAVFLACILYERLVYGWVFLFLDISDFTSILYIICTVLTVLGVIGIVVGLVFTNKMKQLQKKSLVFPMVLIVLALVSSTTVIADCVKSVRDSKATSEYSSSSSSYEMDHSTYCLLYIKISNIKVTHSGNYAYITGKVTNNGNYKIRYVKVKAACKDLRGNTIDTDWTYAVDSSWLDPGESKTFEMMVKDIGNDIKTAIVTVVYD